MISRAKHRCEVFANFTADDLDPARTSAAGVVALKTYLEAAARRGAAADLGPAGAVEMPFADRVAEALRGRGHEVRERIGVAGYFLDLAVVDPERPGSYLLGIEHDGPNYRSARSARDRERLRAEVLARLGWRLHRIWSPDWFRDPDGELRRLLEVLERAKAEAREAQPVRPATPPAAVASIAREEPAAPDDEPPARHRARPPARKIEQISREEIRMAVRQVVESSAGIVAEDLPAQVSRLLGWSRLTRTQRGPIEAVIQEMVEAGELREQGEFLLPGDG